MWLSVDLKLKDQVEVPLTELKEHKEGKLADFPLFEHVRLPVPASWPRFCLFLPRI